MRQFGGTLLVMVVALHSGLTLGQEQNPLVKQTPQFKAATELVLIDTQVVARDGAPIGGLKADQFEVFIDGRKRAVVTAEFLNAATTPSAGVSRPDAAAAPPTASGRVIMLAVDEVSFPVTAQESAREAVTRVVGRVSPDDYLGMVTFPGRTEIAPIRDRKPIRDAIPRITGARVEIASSQYSISATEAMMLKSRDSLATKEITDRECLQRVVRVDDQCPRLVIQDGQRIADALEQQGLMTIDGLQRVIGGMAAIPGRKTLIVISAGLPTNNRPGGRPNLDAETANIARRAAAANLNLYVFYLNVHFLRYFSPAYGKRNYSIFEDITTFATGLEKFADTAGGAFFQVEVDSDPFVDRALRETSAAYLLAVQAEASDRDGREHFIRVTVKARNSTIRYRRVLTIPR
jgi:VWFA-related protein